MDCFDEAVELLGERGYLAENFKTGTHLAYWLQDFQDRFETCRQQAILDGKPGNLLMETFGKFNGGLELVFFTFRYRYDPAEDVLLLKGVHARLGKLAKSYILSTSDDLKSAFTIQDTLSKAVALDNNAPLFRQLQKDFEQERNRSNDYQPDKPDYPRKNHPEKLSGLPDTAKLLTGEPPPALKRLLRK